MQQKALTGNVPTMVMFATEMPAEVLLVLGHIFGIKQRTKQVYVE